MFDDDWNFIGFSGVDPLSVGPQNSHPDYLAGNRNTYAVTEVRDVTLDDSLTFVKSGWGGEHTLEERFRFMRNASLPRAEGANFIGNYTFPTNAPFNAANPRTYPWRFQLAMGQVDFDTIDYRVGGYISDKWAVSRNLTLNLGLRYHWQDAVPETTDALGPRLGFAYNVGGADRTVIRGGVGKVYRFQQTAVLVTLARGTVTAPQVTYDTAQVASPAITGQLPTGSTSDRTACLQPVAGAKPGVAVISPPAVAFLEGMRSQVLAGGFVNNTTGGPTVDGDRRLSYTWNYSIGVKRELMTDVAASVDYVGNRGYDNVAAIDIDEGPIAPATGRVTRLGVSGFDPNGTLVPASGAEHDVRPVQPVPDARRLRQRLRLAGSWAGKRYSNRWAGRVSYTLARCRDVVNPLAVGAFIDDRDPRRDYGACQRDNRHAFSSSANVEIWRGLGAGMVFTAYSGYPINETVGSDVNGDGINNDRPVRGVNDLTTPILSPVDSSGMAVRNGIDGSNKVSLGARAQYIWRIQRYQAGMFLEIYNPDELTSIMQTQAATRNSSVFMVPILADDPRTAQIGFRLTF